MKTPLIIFSLLCTGMTYSQVEAIEITPMFGYTFNGSIAQYGQYYDLTNAVSFGGLVDIEVYSKNHIEISYRRSIQTVHYEESFSSGQFEVGMEQYHFGLVQELGENYKVKPFWNFALGTTRYFEQDKRWSEAYRFSLAAGIGAKFFLTNNIGFRIQSQLVVPMYYGGFGVFCDGAGYCSGSTSFNIPILHFDLSGGLIVRIPTKR